jgi:hypothetical protein
LRILNIPYDLYLLPSGNYSTGVTTFSIIEGVADHIFTLIASEG